MPINDTNLDMPKLYKTIVQNIATYVKRTDGLENRCNLLCCKILYFCGMCWDQQVNKELNCA